MNRIGLVTKNIISQTIDVRCGISAYRRSRRDVTALSLHIYYTALSFTRSRMVMFRHKSLKERQATPPTVKESQRCRFGTDSKNARIRSS